jgi:hypothetical protein
MITIQEALDNLRKVAEAFEGTYPQHRALQESLAVVEGEIAAVAVIKTGNEAMNKKDKK